MHLPLPVALSFFLLSLLSPALALYTPTSPRDGGKKSSNFVSVSGTGFSVHDQNFTFVGTNAYWLPYLNSDDDVRNTLANMSANGISVVRTWAFNDVTTIPDSGSWLLLIQNGNLTLNNGTNGIQRLDKVIKFAKEFNIYVYFSLTNNWFPTVNAPPPSDNSSVTLKRNYLSNHYGGMDVYVKEFGGKKKTHDEFYTNKKIRKEFYKYVKTIVKRYRHEPGVIAWELANDARCSSTLPSSENCNTNTITRWYADTAKFVRSIDPNHLITSGDHGFFCSTCPKLFPAPTSKRSTIRKRIVDGFMTRLKLGKRLVKSPDGTAIRGLWRAPPKAKRQSTGSLSVYNGAFGVDSEDILNAPNIDFGTFQLFPDQVNYGIAGTADNVQPPSSSFNTTLNDTTSFIGSHTQSASTLSKPVVLSAFGIVTQDNLPFFVPFNETFPVAISSPSRKRQSTGSVGTGVTGTQIDTTYSSWLQAVQSGAGGASQYQWTAQQVLVGDGVVPNPGPSSPGQPIPNTGSTPNDGFGIPGPDEAGIPQLLNSTAQGAPLPV